MLLCYVAIMHCIMLLQTCDINNAKSIIIFEHHLKVVSIKKHFIHLLLFCFTVTCRYGVIFGRPQEIKRFGKIRGNLSLVVSLMNIITFKLVGNGCHFLSVRFNSLCTYKDYIELHSVAVFIYIVKHCC